MTDYPSFLGVRGVAGHGTFSLKTGIVLGKSERAGHRIPACIGKDEVRIRWKPLDCFILPGIVMCILDGLDEGVVFH